jgi:hypothetical protein
VQLAHALDVDDGGAVDAGELPRVQPRLQVGQALAHQMDLIAGVQLHVVVGRLDPVDRVGRHEHRAVSLAHHEAAHERPDGLLALLEQVEQALLDRSRAVRAKVLLGPPQRRAEAVVVERLEQVVERVHLEGAQRVLVVGGDEHDDRHRARSDRLHHVEAAHLRHVHVQEHDVGPRARHQLLGLRAGAGPDHGDLRIAGQVELHGLAGQRLVVDDEDADQACSSSNGRIRLATTPPRALRSVKVWRPPYSCSSRARVLSSPMPRRTGSCSDPLL